MIKFNQYEELGETKEVYEPVTGEKGMFNLVVEQTYYFKTTYEGAKQKTKEQKMVQRVNTGITMQQVDKYTLQSTRLKTDKKDDVSKKKN